MNIRDLAYHIYSAPHIAGPKTGPEYSMTREEYADYLEAENQKRWETGEAQKAFRKAFNDDREKMNRFADNIDKYVQALRTDADEYERAENQNTNIATQRK